MGATGATLYDVAGGHDLALTNMELDADWTQSEHGAVLDIDADADEYVSGSAVASLLEYPFTVVLWAQRDADSGHQYMFGVSNDTVEDEYMSVGMGGTGDAVFRVASGGTGNSVTSTIGIDDLDFHVVSAVGVSATERHVFLDGGYKGTKTNNRPTSAFNSMAFGRVPKPTPLTDRCNFLCCLVYNRALADAEVAEISADPLAPLRRKLRVPLAAPAAAAGLSIPIAAYHYNHNIGAMV
jgi:hypothetical protein